MLKCGPVPQPSPFSPALLWKGGSPCSTSSTQAHVLPESFAPLIKLPYSSLPSLSASGNVLHTVVHTRLHVLYLEMMIPHQHIKTIFISLMPLGILLYGYTTISCWLTTPLWWTCGLFLIFCWNNIGIYTSFVHAFSGSRITGSKLMCINIFDRYY